MKNNEQLIVSASPFVFVLSCLTLAALYGVRGAVPEEEMAVYKETLKASWVCWIAIITTALVMWSVGLPSFKKMVSAAIVAVLGASVLLTSAVLQFNFLAQGLIMFAVVVPVGNSIFRKLTKQ